VTASPKRYVRAVIGLALAGYLLIALTTPLVDPDEGRNAEVTREMVAGGDLVVPHLAGMPYLDKPPGLFWLAALPVKLLGPAPVAVRLPAIIAALLTLILVARLALLEIDPGFALRAVTLTAAAPLFAVIAAYVIFDMPLALCVTVIWTTLARELIHGQDHGRRAVMFAALTAGLLIKGPVMLGWAVGGALATALLLRSRDPLRWLGWWPGWVIVLTFAGGWFALATARFPEYPRYAFLEESLERMTQGTFRREQPWWFVPMVLAAGALPWSIATPWRRTAWRPPAPGARVVELADRRRMIAAVALGFVLFAVVFFTLSRSKLVTYLVPALPALAWLAADAWSAPRPARTSAWILAGLYLLLAIGFVVLRATLPTASADVRLGWVITSIAFVCAAALAAFAALRSRPSLALFAAALFTPIVLSADAPQLRHEASSRSGAPLARAIRESGGGAVHYEACYSPGTDFLLGVVSTLALQRGDETTSNYQFRYRSTLVRRGLWTPTGDDAAADRAAVRVRPAGMAPPEGWTSIFSDARFVAYRRGR
jgi:4-amino-4-deoxy-L-arabinose transferase-like glycosyltransferase